MLAQLLDPALAQVEHRPSAGGAVSSLSARWPRILDDEPWLALSDDMPAVMPAPAFLAGGTDFDGEKERPGGAGHLQRGDDLALHAIGDVV